MRENRNNRLLISRDGTNYVVPFFLVTVCFALWGFANDITNPMVKAFSKVFRMSVTEGALVQVAFYGGYFCMALPAALFIRRFSYKRGVQTGLLLYAIGTLMFLPASWTGRFFPFLVVYFILTCGLSFLETSSNPFVMKMGDRETAARRLTLAQSFNPIGSLAGMYVAMQYIQARMNPLCTEQRATLDDTSFAALKQADLQVMVKPYLALGIVLLAMLLLTVLAKMPSLKDAAAGKLPGGTQHSVSKSGLAGECSCKPALRQKKRSGVVHRLFRNVGYRRGVVAQFFYVGAQITCWTFIIQYGTQVFVAEGMAEQEAEIMSQQLNIVAMVCFCLMRFVNTWLMRYVPPRRLLSLFALIGAALLCVTIFVGGRTGLYSLVAVSACMSLMFPTIYALALDGVGEDTEIGSAGLIMAILGGSLLPPLQAMIIDGNGLAGIAAVNLSFMVPLLCFVVVMCYGMTYGKKPC